MEPVDRKNSDSAGDKKADNRTYEAPRITWREPYETVAFGAVSCAQQPGNPGCEPGPLSA
jgi:hypothetical protein